MRPTKDRLLEVITYVVPGSDDVTYTHAVFAQYFLPIRKLPKAARVRAEAELRTLKTAPASAAAPAAAGAAPAAELPLFVSFRSPVPQGWLFVRFGDREVFRRAFDFGPRSGGGLVEGGADLPPGSGELRVWVIAADGSVRDYATRKLDRSGDERRTLVVELDAARKLSLAVK